MKMSPIIFAWAMGILWWTTSAPALSQDIQAKTAWCLGNSVSVSKADQQQIQELQKSIEKSMTKKHMAVPTKWFGETQHTWLEYFFFQEPIAIWEVSIKKFSVSMFSQKWETSIDTVSLNLDTEANMNETTNSSRDIKNGGWLYISISNKWSCSFSTRHIGSGINQLSSSEIIQILWKISKALD